MAVRVKRDIFTGELVSEEYEPSPTGRSVIARETVKYAPKRAVQKAIRPDKPHVSRSLGIHPKQAASFNKKLQSLGINDAHYSDKTGFLISESADAKAAAFAQRTYFDQDATSGFAMRLADRMGY